MAMIQQLGLATLFVTSSAAETRWPHLLKFMAHNNFNRQLTDEQCHHLSQGKIGDLEAVMQYLELDIFSIFSVFFKTLKKNPVSLFGKSADY
jgi:hypothetical protein